jgi:hypothetical protein
MAHEPLVDLRSLVGGNVVEEEMDVESVGHAAIDEIQEATELDRSVPFGHVGNDVPRCDIEGGVEVGRASSH